jgi:transcriptional regulator with XRE-family HTH domain
MGTVEPMVNIGTVMPMRTPRERSAFGQRMYEARRAADLTQEQAAARLGTSQSNLSDLEGGAERSGLTAQAAVLYGCDPHWLATGEGEPSRQGVAHRLSLPIFDTPSLTFEEVTMQLTNLPPQFVFAVPDGALGAMYPKGTRLLWSTAREPMAERILLVRDQYGEAHVRQYHRGAQPGQWSAAALSPSYPSFDGSTVTVLAVAQTEMRDLP